MWLKSHKLRHTNCSDPRVNLLNVYSVQVRQVMDVLHFSCGLGPGLFQIASFHARDCTLLQAIRLTVLNILEINSLFGNPVPV